MDRLKHALFLQRISVVLEQVQEVQETIAKTWQSTI